MKKYQEYKNLNLSTIADEILEYWEQKEIFKKSIANRESKSPFVFYEGPPSANGLPGIHHVMARTVKDIFCRYKTLKGFQVKRKAGWDTHGLPIELEVEKALGITKEDIGEKISIEEYNNACRKNVMQYTHIWNDLTRKMGYWVDMDDPYVTYHNKYIESVWYLLKELYKRNLLYKGYTIQPYSPAAGTGLSTHELNQPGCYKNVKDTTVVAQFKIEKDKKSEFLYKNTDVPIYFLAWTTTPWTLPSNTALALGKNIYYSFVATINRYTEEVSVVALAEDLYDKYFHEILITEDFSEEEKKELEEIDDKILFLKRFKEKGIKPQKDKVIGIKLGRFQGKDLEGIRYEQLLPYAQPKDGDAFRVVTGDFVSTEEGTGIVHIAPSFGSDDFRVAKQHGIGSLTLVDKQGRFTSEVIDFAGEYVKEEYLGSKPSADYKSVDVRIAIKLKEENKAFKVEKYEHTYPHCWRTDKPILYYPLDSWFIKTTALKERMIELNNTINWKPESTGTGRFGNWLENLQDWNLSRSRYWGIPIPIWTTADKKEQICIGSVEELKIEIGKAVQAGLMKKNPLEKFNSENFSEENYSSFDLHRPYADSIILVSKNGKPMYREADLIDVWFDSGAMPYAQVHYPFENKELIDQRKYYPADFIAEGVDQTRGWFFTLHAIAVMLFDSVAYKNVVSNGLVLDKDGNKMSKRLGNAVDPFETLKKYGPDATRWYMVTNAQPWDNLKFDLEGIAEVQRKFFGTLYNTYTFFALYANIDKFTYSEKDISVKDRPEIDRWIISVLNSLIKEVDECLSDYEPTKVGRAIENFIDQHLSNWYVRLSRRRFWKGDYSQDKVASYQTLYTCLEIIAQLASSIAPFFMDRLFTDLNTVTNKHKVESVHLTDFPKCNEDLIDKALEERMEIAQKISSMVLSLRKKQNIRVRQPLNKILVPILNEHFRTQLEAVKELILSEVNVKNIEYLAENSELLIKKVKPNFKVLGPKYGKNMKPIAEEITNFKQNDIKKIEQQGFYELDINGELIRIDLNDVEIISDDIPGWLVTNTDNLTVALDITITEPLKEEGIARELVSKVQNIRKDKDYAVTDKIVLQIQANEAINSAISNNLTYICNETLAVSLELVKHIDSKEAVQIEVTDKITTNITINKYTNGK